MNKFYIQVVFFLLSIFICVNNITLATVPTPKEQNNKTLPTGLTPKEQIDKLYDIGLTPGEQSIKLFNAVLPPEELNKRNREYMLSLEHHKKQKKNKRNNKTKEKIKEITKTKAKPKKTCYTPEEIYKQNKDLLCTNPNEIKNAENFMNETVTQLEHHATNNDSYDVCKWSPIHFGTFYRKKHEDTIVQRILFHQKKEL
ncbi:fam-a protein, fragment [Plasmodium vinckei petteri]|uniref:Fam-a protein n=1 Tax=Plasmodium vinckei petteri TaxID=138298 RepID=A0A6V7SFF3_PLAVN|nr:fam-a protein, fragment [Plasmodium vinckei petteri]